MAEPERRTVIEGVDFGHIFVFPRILRAVTMAFQPARLIIGLLLVLALLTAGRIWDGVTEARISPSGLLTGERSTEQGENAHAALVSIVQQNVDESRQPKGDSADWVLTPQQVTKKIRDEYRHQMAGATDEESALIVEASQNLLDRIDNLRPRGTFEASAEFVADNVTDLIRGIIDLKPQTSYTAAANLLHLFPPAIWDHSKLFVIFYGLIFVILTSVAGGALARMTACEVATGEKLRMNEAMDFAFGAWVRLTLAPLFPLLIAAVLWIVLAVGGKLLMLPWVDILGGLLYGLGLLVGFGLALLLVGYAAGFSLLVPAVATENCDPADAQQRAYAYVLSRPLHLIGYLAVGLIGMALGYVVVGLFGSLLLNVTGGVARVWTDNSALTTTGGATLFDLSPDGQALHANGHSAVAGWFIGLWTTVVVCLAAGYIFSYFFSASTVIYLLLRRAADGQEVTEIWQAGIAGAGSPTADRSDSGEPTNTDA